jgi:septal ring factor EnvC (AmiA/AmiB activator)
MSNQVKNLENTNNNLNDEINKYKNLLKVLEGTIEDSNIEIGALLVKQKNQINDIEKLNKKIKKYKAN